MTGPAAEPLVRLVHRVTLAPDHTQTLPRRQAAWMGTQFAAAMVLAATHWTSAMPELAVLPLALGAAATQPRRSWTHAIALTGAWGAAMLAGLVVDGPSTASAWLSEAPTHGPVALHGLQLLAAAAVVGASLPSLDGGPTETWRRAQGALALVATSGLGWFVAERLIPAGWTLTAQVGMGAIVTSLVCAQALVVLSLRWTTRSRIPHRDKLTEALRADHRGPALQAWQLDHDLAQLSPDPETRDGLGEVAAWVFRLQWTRQQLISERERTGSEDLHTRIATLTEQAEAAADTFTRDRLLATVDHLQRLRGHQDALDAELSRVAALTEYAIAFLEEARAELTLARMTPGDATPDRLPDVLDRLRAYSNERAVNRKTQREVAHIT